MTQRQILNGIQWGLLIAFVSLFLFTPCQYLDLNDFNRYIMAPSNSVSGKVGFDPSLSDDLFIGCAALVEGILICQKQKWVYVLRVALNIVRICIPCGVVCLAIMCKVFGSDAFVATVTWHPYLLCVLGLMSLALHIYMRKQDIKAMNPADD